MPYRGRRTCVRAQALSLAADGPAAATAAQTQAGIRGRFREPATASRQSELLHARSVWRTLPLRSAPHPPFNKGTPSALRGGVDGPVDESGKTRGSLPTERGVPRLERRLHGRSAEKPSQWLFPRESKLVSRIAVQPFLCASIASYAIVRERDVRRSCVGVLKLDTGRVNHNVTLRRDIVALVL
jgi:hypothetical protein